MQDRSPNANSHVSLFYKGPSMNPVLTSPDVLYVRPYNGIRVKCGDVVVFASPDIDCKVVHRVVSVNGGEIRTKGDNNSRTDSWVLRQQDIIGRVEWIERGKRKTRIYGGLPGKAQAGVLKAMRLLDAGIRTVLKPAYNRLSQNRALRKWLASRSRTRTISILRPEGIELQLLLGKRVIGRRPAEKRQWLVRRPYLLFVDDATLQMSTDTREEKSV
jgi:hypothetical protein